MINFSESSEYQRKMTGKINVVMTYGMLNKMPTSSDLTTWEPKALTDIIETPASRRPTEPG
ncbi:MAG: hypothetical protein R2702_06555 [Acidimicrobiales bacterium]